MFWPAAKTLFIACPSTKIQLHVVVQTPQSLKFRLDSVHWKQL